MRSGGDVRRQEAQPWTVPAAGVAAFIGFVLLISWSVGHFVIRASIEADGNGRYQTTLSGSALEVVVGPYTSLVIGILLMLFAFHGVRGRGWARIGVTLMGGTELALFIYYSVVLWPWVLLCAVVVAPVLTSVTLFWVSATNRWFREQEGVV